VPDAKKPAESSETDSSASGAEKTESAPPAKEAKEAKEPKEPKEKRSRDTGKKLVAGANALRTRIATVVWLVAVVCALFLAVGALMVALKANNDNAIVSFVKDVAHFLDLGVFSPDNGLFTPKKDPDLIKGALINWGLGAIAYLVVGKLLDRLIRP
jgi:uncharacterized membrane protein